MSDQQTCASPVIVTLPAQLDAAAAEQAAGQITAAFTPGVRVVIADLTAAARCDRSAIRNLLRAHRKAATRGGQVRFAIRPDGPLHQITGFAGTHPLLAVYPTLQHALTGRSPTPTGNRTASPAATIEGAACNQPRTSMIALGQQQAYAHGIRVPSPLTGRPSSPAISFQVSARGSPSETTFHARTRTTYQR